MSNTSAALQQRIREEIDKIPIIDSHQHLIPPQLLAQRTNLDVSYLFAAYVSFELASAGMPTKDFEELRNVESKLSSQQRWELIRPWYQRCWNTAFCEAIRLGVQDLYGYDDITDDTHEAISAKMAAAPRDTWIRTVFDKAGVDLAIQINAAGYMGFPRTRYPDIFLDDIYDHFTRLNHDFVNQISRETDISIGSLDDFLTACDWHFDKFADEATAFKISRAYDRSLSVDTVTKAEAAPIYNRFLKGETVSPAENKAAEDFIIRYMVGKSGEYNLPVKIHTGIPINNGRAASLLNLIHDFPNVQFCLFHLSWPYAEELVEMAMFEPNIWVDFCWAWGMNPVSTRRYLSEMLECVPYCKIHGFGGDTNYVEDAYGQTMIAKREITRVLSEKVEEGHFTEDYALFLARRILRDNLIEHFNIDEKRRIYRERGPERK